MVGRIKEKFEISRMLLVVVVAMMMSWC